MSEHAEQCMLFQLCDLARGRYPELSLLHAVQNWAGVKGPREGARRKAEGVRAGVPDLHLPVPRGGYASLYVEMKREKLRPTKTKGVRRDRTKTTAEQDAWIEGLRKVGNRVEVCYTADEAWEVIEGYLNSNDPTFAEAVPHE